MLRERKIALFSARYDGPCLGTRLPLEGLTAPLREDRFELLTIVANNCLDLALAAFSKLSEALCPGILWSPLASMATFRGGGGG